MSLPSKARDQLISFNTENLPLDSQGRVLTDLFVELPRNDRFIRYICSGDPLTTRHLATLARHVNANIYVILADLESSRAEPLPDESAIAHEIRSISKKNPTRAETERRFQGEQEAYGSSKKTILSGDSSSFNSHRSTPTPESFEGSRKSLDNSEKEIAMASHLGKDNAEFLKKPIATELKNIFLDLISPSPAKFNLEDSPVNELTDRLVKIIAPEVENLRLYLKAIPQYVGIMEDSAAITAIATLFAIARGQSSRSIFKDLSYACLFMDISLADFDEEAWKTYYLKPENLSTEDKKKVLSHPTRSSELVQKRFKNIPDIVIQLIVGHHELFSGRGYPRQLRSERLAPLVKILAFAVDVFEHMKRQYLRGKVCNLEEAVHFFQFESVEPHRRRHSATLCREVAEFLRSDGL